MKVKTARQLSRLRGVLFRLVAPGSACLAGLLCFMLNTVAAAPLKQANLDYRFSSVDIAELEKIGIQRSVVEDSQGFMWFGGANGLARFDGYTVKVYRNNPEDTRSLSYNEVTALMTDPQGRLWVGTTGGLNLYDKNTDGFIHYTPNSEQERHRLPSNTITALSQDPSGNIWVGSMDSGFFKIDGRSASVEAVSISSSTLPEDQPIAIRALYASSSGLLWLGINKLGLSVFNTKTGALYYPQDKSAFTQKANINKIIQGPKNNIWLATSSSGLLRLNPLTGDFKQYRNEPNKPHSLHHNSVWDMYFDRNNMLWVASDDSLELYQAESDNFKHFTHLTGTNLYGKVRALYQSKSDQFWLGMFPTGTAYLDKDATVFRNFQSNPKDLNSLSHTSVTAIAEDRLGNLWIGTEGGLDYFNTANQTITHYLHEEGNPDSLPSNSVLSLVIDKTDTLWVGTWKGGWARFNNKTKAFTRPKLADGTTDHLEEEVWNMYEDRQGRLWVGGLYLYNRELDHFVHYRQAYPNGDELSFPRVRAMYEDRLGNFWIGTIAGLDLFDRVTGKIQHFHINDTSPANLSDHYILSILEDSGGDLWFGTLAGGINKLDRNTSEFSRINANDGLFDDSITGMIEDNSGSLWMIGGSGLIRYHKSSGNFELFDRKNGLSGDLFHRNAIILSRKGDIVFGGANGLTILNPDELKANTIVPPIVLTELEVLNAAVSASSHSSILTKPINFTKSITLKNEHNVFSIQYSALNYRMSGQNKYAYMLQGFDTDWHNVGNNRRATYTNLDPGNYVFKVRGSNNSGLWNNTGATLNIKVLPSGWKTPIAYFIYILLGVALLSGLFLVLLRLRQAKNERRINTQLRELDQMKDSFLANTSHELRTPLNGIIGLTEAIISEPDNINNEDTLNKLKIVVNSGKRLSNIINDILDFSKLKSYEIELNKTSIDLYTLVHSTVELSQSLIDTKPITLINNVTPQFPKFLADEQRLSQILFNLVGNAIKFTEQGEVKISATADGDQIRIEVSDSGIGIAPSDCERIFLPFEQTLATITSGKAVGTGLGLAVTKKLVDLHGGNIQITSTEGSGSTFIVTLPYTDVSALPQHSSQQLLANHRPAHMPFGPANKSQLSAHTATAGNESIKLLIVDDEPVNRMVLEGYLAKLNYTVVESTNGLEAIEKIKTHGPFDLILLDVMMPGISGYETCTEIRKSFHLLELPVLFLTAKSRPEDLEEGYEVGANDFLYKPVIKQELLAKINMHLRASQEYRKLSKFRI